MTMPEPEAPRKPRRRWVLLPYVLVLLLAAAWSVNWFITKDRILKTLEAAKAPANGHQLAFKSASLSGFPFRYNLVLTDPGFSETSGWGVSAPKLEVEASAFNPRHLVAVAPQGLTLTRPEKGAVQITGEALRASVAGLPSRPRISIEGVKVRIAPLAGGKPLPFAALDKFELHVRPEDGDKGRVYLALTNAAPAPDSLLARAADGLAAVKLQAVVSSLSQMHGADLPQLLRRWTAAGGELTLVGAEAQVGKAVLSAKESSLALDADGRLRGKLDLSLRQGSAGMLALGATGVLPEETAAVGAGLAGESAHVVLHFKEGRTLIGPLPIGRAPKVY